MADQAVENSKKMKAKWVDISSVNENEMKKALEKQFKILNDLSNRAESLFNEVGRSDELKEKVSQIGLLLLEISLHNLTSFGKGLSEKLHKIGRELHLVETKKIYIDGGESIQNITATIKDNSQKLEILLKEYKVN